MRHMIVGLLGAITGYLIITLFLTFVFSGVYYLIGHFVFGISVNFRLLFIVLWSIIWFFSFFYMFIDMMTKEGTVVDEKDGDE